MNNKKIEGTTLTHFDGWLDNQDIIVAFHISLRTLQNLRSRGELPYSILGGRCFYKKEDVERMMEKKYGLMVKKGGTGK
ncbi:MAG: helix-turn-helix domain-containing protein [Bacteroidaceae bacterium]|nr:helix-turn-helix domain-containing protein [Bacteroidaceae bacterium]